MCADPATASRVHVVPIAARQLGLEAPAGVPGRNIRKCRGDPGSPVRVIRLKGDGVRAIIFQYCSAPSMVLKCYLTKRMRSL